MVAEVRVPPSAVVPAAEAEAADDGLDGGAAADVDRASADDEAAPAAAAMGHATGRVAGGAGAPDDDVDEADGAPARLAGGPRASAPRMADLAVLTTLLGRGLRSFGGTNGPQSRLRLRLGDLLGLFLGPPWDLSWGALSQLAPAPELLLVASRARPLRSGCSRARPCSCSPRE